MNNEQKRTGSKDRGPERVGGRYRRGPEAIRDSIKAEMMERDTDELEAGAYIVRWTSILSNRFDTTAFKKAHGELYQAFTKQSASRRFTISA